MPLLAVALSFPAVVYTVLLGVVLAYWLFVMVGAAQIDLLGEGAADAALEGVAKGAVEGVAKGAVEGVAKGALEGAADAGADAIAPDGAWAGIVSALRLRSAPATVVLSLVVLFAWTLTILGARLVALVPGDGALVTAAEIALLALAPVLALFPTAVVVRPLGRVFTTPAATKRADLIGKLCTIRTGTVTDRFGEALLEDGGAGLVVRVRVDAGEKLGRGDQAVIVGYDAERQEFSVAPLDDLLGEEPLARRAR